MNASLTQPIRILHVVQRMEAAGLQSFIMNIYRKIDRTKVQFDFLTHYSKRDFYDDEIESMGGRIYRLSVREDRNLIKYIKNLCSFFKAHREYQVVHGHMDSLGVFYLGIARMYGVKCRIAHAHNVLTEGDIKKRARHLLNRAYKWNATQLFACSDMAGQYMFGRSPFTVIHNPIDVRSFGFSDRIRREVRQELELSNHFVIGHIGRYALQKNHLFLIDVFAEVLKLRPDARLLLVGDGELKEKVNQYIEQKGIGDCVVQTGVRRDVNRLCQAMDCFLFPSLYEGLGIVAIEAQASGLPTFCSDKVPELARATDLFFSIPLETPPAEWAKFVVRHTDQNAKRREDYQQDLVMAGYDVNEVKDKLISYYYQ